MQRQMDFILFSLVHQSLNAKQVAAFVKAPVCFTFLYSFCLAGVIDLLHSAI
jgi:hypothetical protein